MEGPLLSIAIAGWPTRTLKNVHVARPPAASAMVSETVPARVRALRASGLHETLEVYWLGSVGATACSTAV